MSKAEHHVVLISGAASGIGRRTAERFLERGDEVHICDVSQDAVDEFLAANAGASGTVADIGKRADVDRVFADVRKSHDYLDILVNNAGIAGPSAPVDEHDEEGWESCIQVNLSGTNGSAAWLSPPFRLRRKQVGHDRSDENLGDGAGSPGDSREYRLPDECGRAPHRCGHRSGSRTPRATGRESSRSLFAANVDAHVRIAG
jgi:NAD(P)-dependent dehydrogenase (short-subunit alcohol dehydrogenase family)